ELIFVEVLRAFVARLPAIGALQAYPPLACCELAFDAGSLACEQFARAGRVHVRRLVPPGLDRRDTEPAVGAGRLSKMGTAPPWCGGPPAGTLALCLRRGQCTRCALARRPRGVRRRAPLSRTPKRPPRLAAMRC